MPFAMPKGTRGVRMSGGAKILVKWVNNLMAVSIFAHTPPPVRRHSHRGAVGGFKAGRRLRPGGLTTGATAVQDWGPPVAEMMMNLTGLSAELAGMDFEYAEEAVREVQEGPPHHGQAAVAAR